MPTPSRAPSRRTARLLSAATVTVLALAALIGGCGGGDTGPDVTPATISISPSSATVQSGQTTSFSASVLNKSGSPVAGVQVTWTSADQTIATVSASGVVSGLKAGQTTVSAAAGSASASVAITVVPGPAAIIVVTTQPTGAVDGVALTTEPVVAVRDAAGNAVTTSTAVQATLSGGGTLGGTTTVNTTNGVATFTDLAVTGTVGDRTLSFSTAGVTAVQSQAFTLALGAPSAVVVRTQPAGAAAGAALTTQPAVEIRDVGGNVVTSSTASVTAAIALGSGTLSGTTSVAAVSGVATFTNLAIAGTAGSFKLGFTASAMKPDTSAAFTLAPGAATQLAVKTMPTAATTGVALSPAPVVEVHDASGNVVTSSTVIVTAAVSTGTATVSGTSSVASASGVATFSNLVLTGAPNTVTLAFTAQGLAQASSGPIALGAAPPAQIGFGVAADTLGWRLGFAATTGSVSVVNTGASSLTGLSVQSVTYASGETANWLSATLASATAPTSLAFTTSTTGLAVGTYHATVKVASSVAANSPQSLPVVLTVAPAVSYGASTAKVAIVDIGTTASPTVSITDDKGNTTTDNTVSFAARAPSVASVSSSGVITALAAGEGWVSAVTPQGAADSVYVIVPKSATAPILRTDLTKYSWTGGDTVVVNVVLDTRSATKLGAITGVVSWTNDYTSGVLTFIDVSVAGSPLTVTTAVDSTIGTVRFSGASSSGASGAVQLMKLRFLARHAHTGFIYLNATEVKADDLTDLWPSTTLTQYPVIAK